LFTLSALNTPRGEARVLAVVAGALAVSALIELVFRVELLTWLTPGLAPMKFNAAVGILFLAGTFVLPARFALAAAAIVGAIALATVGEYAVGANFGIDEFVVRGPVTSGHPGRIAFGGACCLLLLAGSVASIAVGRRRFVQPVASLVLALSALALIGYCYGVPALYSAVGGSPVAAPTAAVALLLLSVALLLYVPDSAVWWALHGPDAGGVVLRRLLPVTLIVLPVLGYLELAVRRADWYDPGLGLAMLVTTSAVTVIVVGWKTAVVLAKVDAQRRSALHDLQALTADLDQRVRVRTAELEAERQALRESEAKARAANDAKDSLLSRISHELRTPLNAVLGFAQLLESDVTTASDRASVAQILQGGRHLLALVEEVTNINQLEAGEMPLILEPVAIAGVVADALELVAPMATEHSVRLESDGPGTRHDVVQADRQRLTQVLVSILSNAVNYNYLDGSVTLTCRHPRSDSIRVLIQDTGPGISQDGLARLFTPFDRIDAPEQGVDGSGLELTLAKHLTEAMGGTLGVDSTLGVGSTFWVEFPLSAAELPIPLQRFRAREGGLAAFE